MGVHVTPSSFGGGHGIRDSGLGIRNSGLGDQGSGIRDLDFSYSTGDTHFIMYATGSSPYGPFTIRGKILEPVLGWTSHHSIVELNGKWYLFYHDAQLSGGQTHLRNIKVTELKYGADGSIETIDAYREETK